MKHYKLFWQKKHNWLAVVRTDSREFLSLDFDTLNFWFNTHSVKKLKRRGWIDLGRLDGK